MHLTLMLGDCVVRLDGLSDIDAIVSDPPYEIAFMGRAWDNQGIASSPEFWNAAFKALRPGGIVKAFSATRTYHRMAVAMEKAGLTNLGVEGWIYGSGFPKSLNVAKKLDQMEYQRREKLIKEALAGQGHASVTWGTGTPVNTLTITVEGQPVEVPQIKGSTFVRPDWLQAASRGSKRIEFTGNALMRHGGDNTRPWMEEALKNGYHELPGDQPASLEAKAWEGWGTALKPAWEPILVARKPL